MRKTLMIAAVALMATATGAYALDAASTIKARQAGMKSIGGATKGLGEQLGGDKDPAQMKAYAAKLAELSGQVPGWFPAGTGKEAGVKTKAGPAIWTDAAGFKTAASALSSQAAKLNAAAQTGDAAKIGPEFMALRATCKGCHDKYQAH